MNKRYQEISKGFFSQNRSQFSKKMASNSIAVFFGNDELLRNGDCLYPYRQDSDFFYLTGIDQEQSILILYPDASTQIKEVLFIRKANSHTKIWEGEKHTKASAKKASGIKNIQWTEEFDSFFKSLSKKVKKIYLINEENNPKELPSGNKRFSRFIKSKHPKIKILPAEKIIHPLRLVKSETETNLINSAIKITKKAFSEVLQNMKPNKMEYEIEAIITYEFMKNGANGHAYAPIVASGKNACVLHYISNHQTCKDGDLVLMDFGAEYGNYASDLTRTIPVNGKFTERQKQVYQSVLNIMKYAKTLLKPGVILSKYHQKVGSKTNEELIKLGLISSKDVGGDIKTSTAYKKYFMHGTSHFMGLDVHDVGDRNKPLPIGAVVTCEPGLYIPEEGIGIRLENDILITENGCVDLMEDIPIEIEEIEKLMNQ